MADYNADKDPTGLDAITMPDIAENDYYIVWDNSEGKMKGIMEGEDCFRLPL